MAEGTTEIPLLMLRRVTLSYDLNEDRIRLAAETHQDDTLTIWLTARLTSRLLPHLQQLAASTAPVPAATPAGEDAASASATEELPVVPSEDGSELLVAAVDVNQPEGNVVLTFRDNALAARLPLTHSQLGLWLAGLEQCVAQSEWQLRRPEGAATESMLAVPASVTIH